MKVDQWEMLCRKFGTKPVEKVVLPECTVYISEGYNSGDEDMARPHFDMFYAFSFKGELDLAHAIKVSAMHHITYAERKRILMRQVDEWIADNKQAGRYSAVTGEGRAYG